MIIKDIFSGKQLGDEAHSEFLKFGRGDFRSKYILEAKKQKDRWSIKSSNEFANYFVKTCLQEAGEKVGIKGIIVSTFDISKEAKFSIGKVKQFMGIKQVVVEGQINKNDILDLMNKFPRAFFALSFVTPTCELKIKAKAPKSAKPSTTGDKEPRAEFCSLKTSNNAIINEVFFDCPNFNEIKVNHTIRVTDIVYPKDMKNMKPEQVREQSKRKGILVRNINADGKTSSREAGFEA